ncbi:MAG: hypothetical protein RQ824_06410 [bacterium]|nr:hypothetical protein [bacterium]
MIKKIISSVKFTAILLAFLITVSPGAAKAGIFDQDSPLIEKRQKGEIDWEKGLIRASGTSAATPVADNESGNIAVKRLAIMRAAKIDAMRNLLDVIKTIRVDATTNVESYMISSDFIRNKVHETIRKAQIINKKFISDDGIEVTIELPMVGSFIETMIPDTGSLTVDAIGTEQESGIIIDASGLGAKPALSPRILDDSGRELYGASYIKRDYFLSKGLVAYRTKLDDARNSARVTSNPIIIKAIRSSGPGSSDLIISKADAKRLKTSSSNLSWLEKGNVIIVLD